MNEKIIDKLNYNEFKLLYLYRYDYSVFMNICNKHNFTDIECEILHDEIADLKGAKND